MQLPTGTELGNNEDDLRKEIFQLKEERLYPPILFHEHTSLC